MQLYGRAWSRRELEERVGRLEQVGGIRRLTLGDGPEAGVEQVQVRTGAGLSYWVSAGRGLDISLAEFGSVPLSWQASPGDVHPAYFDPRGLEWLRTAAGGLLMTCGFTQVGSPCSDGGQDLGLHGRAHHLPARQVSAEGRWLGDEYEMRVAGVVEQAMIFGENVTLIRQIHSRLGENVIRLTDVVRNNGFESVPHMYLYHFNFGFPLLSEKTRLTLPKGRVVPRDAGMTTAGLDAWQSPDASFQERVYYHEDLVGEPNSGGLGTVVAAVIRNPVFPMAGGGTRPLAVRLQWNASLLPRLVQWRMPGAGVHVLGLEPSNCRVGGRARERERGALAFLEPGESRTYDLELSVDAGAGS